ncbi:MAG: 50S ribosomal protein L25 [Armatimonadota bacterium]|nr:50S ribosomal protein L25 [Armatimonadota bacterium]
MQKAKLNAQIRSTHSKSELKQIRRTGQIAASVYGHGFESMSISVDAAELAAAVRTEAGLHALIDMSVDDAPKTASGVVVIKQIQKDPVSRRLLHVDFQRVLMTEKLSTETPIELVGAAIGVHEGGVLEHVMRSLHVRCLPDQIPSHIDLDVSDLDIGHALHVSDLPLPAGVEPLAQPDEVVVAVRQPTIHVEVAAEEAALAEGAPEVTGEQPSAAEQ